MNEKLLEILAKELQRKLTENILDRYDHPEYWDKEVIDEFFGELGLTEEERTLIFKKI